MSKDKPGRMAGKRVLVTGGGSGIGAATAKLFASEGRSCSWPDVLKASLSTRLRLLGSQVEKWAITRQICHQRQLLTRYLMLPAQPWARWIVWLMPPVLDIAGMR